MNQLKDVSKISSSIKTQTTIKLRYRVSIRLQTTQIQAIERKETYIKKTKQIKATKINITFKKKNLPSNIKQTCRLEEKVLPSGSEISHTIIRWWVENILLEFVSIETLVIDGVEILYWAWVVVKGYRARDSLAWAWG